MNFRLAKNFSRIPKAELRRLQIQLRMIIRKGEDPDRLEKSIISALERLGRPWDLLTNKSTGKLNDDFAFLLNRFGTIKKSQVNEKRWNYLIAHPYTINPDDTRCLIFSEAYHLIQTCPAIRKSGYLVSYIHYLGNAEKKAWINWLINKGTRTPLKTSNLTGDIYREILRKRVSKSFSTDDNRDISAPAYLDEVFSNDPAISASGWFFRGILPFYKTLQQMEIEKSSPEISVFINLFKLGILAIRPAKSEFGEPSKWEIFKTREYIESDHTDIEEHLEQHDELPFPGS